MKIRNGFVSNSSSSSFVIAVTGEVEKCPCCGHTPQTIVDLLQGGESRGYYGEESSVEDIEDYLGELDYERNNVESRIVVLEQRDPNELTYPDYPNAREKVKDTLEYYREELLQLKKQIADLEREEGKLYRLTLDNHDHLASHVLDENVETGLVRIIEGDYV